MPKLLDTFRYKGGDGTGHEGHWRPRLHHRQARGLQVWLPFDNSGSIDALTNLGYCGPLTASRALSPPSGEGFGHPINGLSSDYSRGLAISNGLGAFDLSPMPVFQYPRTLSFWAAPITWTGPTASNVVFWWGAGTWNCVAFAFGGTTEPMNASCMHVMNLDFNGGFGVPGAAYFREMHHYVIVLRATNATAMYKDGIWGGGSSYPLSDLSYTFVMFRFGGDYIMSNAGFAEWRDFRVYDRELSPVEVWELYDPATRYALYEQVAPIAYSFPEIIVIPPSGIVHQHHHVIGAV